MKKFTKDDFVKVGEKKAKFEIMTREQWDKKYGRKKKEK